MCNHRSVSTKKGVWTCKSCREPVGFCLYCGKTLVIKKINANDGYCSKRCSKKHEVDCDQINVKKTRIESDDTDRDSSDSGTEYTDYNSEREGEQESHSDSDESNDCQECANGTQDPTLPPIEIFLQDFTKILQEKIATLNSRAQPSRPGFLPTESEMAEVETGKFEIEKILGELPRHQTCLVQWKDGFATWEKTSTVLHTDAYKNFIDKK